MDPHSKCVQVISGSACDTQVGFGCAAAVQQARQTVSAVSGPAECDLGASEVQRRYRF